MNFERVEMDFLDMLTDEELEKLYVDHELEVANKERKKNRRYSNGFSRPAYHWTEEVQQKISNDAIARLQNPKTRGSAKESLKALGEDELQRRYKEKFIPPPPKPKKKSKKERAQEQQEYAEFYQDYIDIRSGKKAPPKQPTSPWQALKEQLPIKELKAHIENQSKDNEVLQGLVNVSKALSGSVEKWEERREERQLNELIPLIPDYLSKIPDEGIYYSRFTFEQLVIKQQKLMTELNLMFGVVAIVGAFFTAGGSLYLFAIANGVWGVAQIGVSTIKLQELNDGVVSETSFLGINQKMLDTTGIFIAGVELLAAIKHGGIYLGNRIANAKNMKAVQELAQPKPRIKGAGETRNPILGQDWDEYLKAKYGEDSVDWVTKGTGRISDVEISIYVSDAEKMLRPYDHLVNVDGFKRGGRPGVSGSHNKENFYQALEEDAIKYGLDVDRDYIIGTPKRHVIEGIYEIEYQIPSLQANNLDRSVLEPIYDSSGKVMGKKVYEPKTVYDPNIISDEKMYNWGKRALEKEMLTKGIWDGQVQGELNGLKFVGYVKNGELSNFYPIFNFKEVR